MKNLNISTQLFHSNTANVRHNLGSEMLEKISSINVINIIFTSA